MSQEVVQVSNTGEIVPDEEWSMSLRSSDVGNFDMGPAFNWKDQQGIGKKMQTHTQTSSY